jgi:hypothetical protein
MKSVILEIDNNCIKSGRGQRVYRHEGNQRFRDLVDEHVQQYLESSKAGKSELVHNVYRDILARGMKFVEEENGNWYEVTSEEEGKRKVSHRFRDAIDAAKKRKAATTTDSDCSDQRSTVEDEEAPISFEDDTSFASGQDSDQGGIMAKKSRSAGLEGLRLSPFRSSSPSHYHVMHNPSQEPLEMRYSESVSKQDFLDEICVEVTELFKEEFTEY